MYRILICTDDGLRMVRWDGPEADPVHGDPKPLAVTAALSGRRVHAVTPHPAAGLLAGTFSRGLWREADDGGWTRVPGIPEDASVTALATGARDSHTDTPVLWVGTEPSQLFRSTDGGRRWTWCGELVHLPSAREWSYPPRPDTHHVRALAPHPRDPAALLVGIEAGAVIRTLDGGRNWEDRRPSSPRDPHRMVHHPGSPERVLVAAGDGFHETPDFGENWIRTARGMEADYVWDVAVDGSGKGGVLAVSARDASRAHGRKPPSAHLYRRTLAPADPAGEAWVEVETGPPGLDGKRVPSLAPVPGVAGAFLLCTQEGELFLTRDGGNRWTPLPLEVDAMAGVGGVVAVQVVGG